jgi:hypothetical protein
MIVPDGAQLILEDSTALAFSDDALPRKSPDPSAFDSRRLFLWWQWLDDPGRGVAIRVQIDPQPATVPEPTTTLLLVVALIAGLTQRYRRTQS